MMAALLAFVPPHTGWTPDPVKGIALAITAAAWLAIALRGAATPQPHDVRLLNRIFELVTQPERAFLRSHDFLADFSLESMKGVREIAVTWVGSSYDFLDPRLQREWAPLKQSIVAFRDLMARTTAPADGDVWLQTVKTVLDRETGEISQRTQDEAVALNEAAEKLSKLLDTFEPHARRRLRV